MIPTFWWAASFLYLSVLTAFVCTAVREDDDRRLVAKTGWFAALIAGGTLAFCAVVWAIERVL